MGAFIGACLLAMAGAWLFTELWGTFEGAAAMGGGEIGAFVGAVAGFALGLWLTLRRGGQSGGKAVTGLTGVAVMMVICFAYVAFS